MRFKFATDITSLLGQKACGNADALIGCLAIMDETINIKAELTHSFSKTFLFAFGRVADIAHTVLHLLCNMVQAQQHILCCLHVAMLNCFHTCSHCIKTSKSFGSFVASIIAMRGKAGIKFSNIGCVLLQVVCKTR
ncbi:MAG: hypothetical protein EBT08_10440 [Betaproteobacteria bacterium]|nr:hypothetical protein [Betaproteobacteria bacterium]